MNDLISRKALCEYALNQKDKSITPNDIMRFPSAQPEPQRMKGKWIELTNTNHTYICSVCGRMLVNIPDGKNKVTKNYPFCHCGADMRGEQDDDNGTD
jgi:hypothetical protein